MSAHTSRTGPAQPAADSTATRRTSERRTDPKAREQLVQRVLAEFHEMPCLRLTPQQAQRLFGLREDVAARIIHALIAKGHLRQDEDGRYVAARAG